MTNVVERVINEMNKAKSILAPYSKTTTYFETSHNNKVIFFLAYENTQNLLAAGTITSDGGVTVLVWGDALRLQATKEMVMNPISKGYARKIIRDYAAREEAAYLSR